MSATLARQQIERTHHDRVASHEPRDFYAWGALAAADAYAYSLIDQPAGRLMLDLGCGRGAHTVHFAQSGASVVAVDLSGSMVAATRRRAINAGVGERVATQQMSAESLGFADATFDYVFGHSVLHHTDLAATRREVHRVLKPGGRAVFLEPLDHNPLLNLFRRLTPWRRTPTEKPLSMADLRFLQKCLRTAYISYPRAAMEANEDDELNVRIRQYGGVIWLDPAIRSVYIARPTLRPLHRLCQENAGPLRGLNRQDESPSRI